jgi:GTPase
MMEPAESGDGGAAATLTRAGYVALVGLPNVGKSTLLNALTGEKLSIVTSRAQTTRDRVMGIYTTERAQAVFVDTPGLLEPRYLLQESMLNAARSALREADLVLLLLDATQPAETPSGSPLELLRRRRGVLMAAINKVDAAGASAVARLEAWCREALELEAARVSAVRGDGVAALRERVVAALPASPFYYPADELAVQPVRFFVAELVRETVFEEYEQEIPYSTAVQVEEFREASDPLYLRVVIFVERESQKGIVVGQGGRGIKQVGSRAREKIEAFLDRRVYLDLWVKVRRNWRRRPEALRELGYEPPKA